MVILEDRFSQQLKKGVLEMLVLELICAGPTYGYELMTSLKERSGGRFLLKEGTLYPILYRLEDEKLIQSGWSVGQGRTAPRKIYEPTELGAAENLRRRQLWQEFQQTVNGFLKETDNDGTGEILQKGSPKAEAAPGVEEAGHE